MPNVSVFEQDAKTLKMIFGNLLIAMFDEDVKLVRNNISLLKEQLNTLEDLCDAVEQG